MSGAASVQLICPQYFVKFAANGTRRYTDNQGETAQDAQFKRHGARMPLAADPELEKEPGVSSMCHRQTQQYKGE